MSMQLDPRGWWHFIFTTGTVGDIYYPTPMAGAPVGQGGVTVSTGSPPGDRLAPADGKHPVMLRGVLPLGPGLGATASFQLRPGDGTGAYFGGLNFTYGTLVGNTTDMLPPPMALPLYDGLSVASLGTAMQNFMLLFEPLGWN